MCGRFFLESESFFLVSNNFSKKYFYFFLVSAPIFLAIETFFLDMPKKFLVLSKIDLLKKI